MKLFVGISLVVVVFMSLLCLAVVDVSGAPLISINRASNSTTAADVPPLSPQVIVSNGVPVAIVFPEPTEAPSPVPTGETLIVETSQGDFEVVTRNTNSKITTSQQYLQAHQTNQNSVSSSDMETIIRKLVEKVHLDSLQEAQNEDTLGQNIWANNRQTATLVPVPTSSGPSDLLLFPPEQLGPNVVRIPLKDSISNVQTLELQIHVIPSDVRVASPTAVLASPVEALPTDVPVPTEIPPPFSQVGSNDPFYFLGPPTFFFPNQTQSSRVFAKDEISRQIGNLVLDQIAQYLSSQQYPVDAFERYIIGKQPLDFEMQRVADATQAPLPTQSSQPKQGTTVPLSLSNLPPPPAVVLPNGSLS